MTVISSIILDAFRESNMLPLGKDPTDNQNAEALRLLNALFLAAYGGDAGERLQDWPLGNFGRQEDVFLPLTDDTINHPPINRRLIATNETAKTVYLSPNPQDGSQMSLVDPFSRLGDFPVTIDANGRTIDSVAEAFFDAAGVSREFFYRADTGDWVMLTNKELSDEMPFPAAFDTMFMILLAMRLNPRYGRTLDEQSAVMLKQGRREFIARYLQSQPLEIDDSISWPFMSRQGFDTQRSFSSQRDFNRGNYRG